MKHVLKCSLVNTKKKKKKSSIGQMFMGYLKVKMQEKEQAK